MRGAESGAEEFLHEMFDDCTLDDFEDTEMKSLRGFVGEDVIKEEV